MPIDAFQRSLADDQGENAAGVVLSGTGTDGTLGLRAIFGAGGLCLVQEPASARYDGMPASAIRAGFATQVLAPGLMPKALQAGMRPLPIRQTLAAAAMVLPAATAAELNKILALVRSATGHDFSLYKKTTIGRRIERRMCRHGIEDVEVYARYLKEHPSERQTLFRELLINVTSFFRDPEAFAVLRTDVLPRRLADKLPGDTMRLWVAGCATGEEAYSIAMLLREVLDETGAEVRVQLYATDLDDDAINIARNGLYTLNIAQDVSPERLRRIFTKEDAGYRVKQVIREMVVFAVQSVIKDPPLTRLDLLACRNLMIYLEPELQNRLIPAFHYALKPGGVLFLSPSESTGHHTDLFDPIDRKWKLYTARPTVASTRKVLGSGLSWAAASGGLTQPPPVQKAKESQLADLAKRALLQLFAPAAVVTDLQGNLIYVHGETGKFLRPAPGQPSNNVVAMAREGLALELREARRQAALQSLPTLNRRLNVNTNGHTQPVSLSVRFLPELEGLQSALLVSIPGTSRRGVDHAGTQAAPWWPGRGAARSENRARAGQRERKPHGHARRAAGIQRGTEVDQRGTAEHQ